MQRELGQILEKNGPEFEEFVQNEVDKNPALEVKSQPDDDIDKRTEDGSDYNESPEELQRRDYSDDDDRPTMPTTPRYRAGNRSADDEYHEPTAVATETLYDHLNAQIHELELTPKQITIAQNIIGNLNDKGYLERTVSAIADDLTFNESLDTSPDEVSVVLEQIQQLDPAGVAASNLQECILLQLQRMPKSPANTLAQQIVSKYWELFSKRQFETVMRRMSISQSQLRAVINEIRRTNPYPGSNFASTGMNIGGQITPDFVVELEGDKLTVTLRNSAPQLQIAETYDIEDKRIRNGAPLSARQNANRRIIRDSVDNARHFLELLKMRQQTLFDTMKAIVQWQEKYFLTGDEACLKPLRLKDIADITGKDVSTISRATNNKYVDTPYGIKPLRFFFSEGINTHPKTDDDEATEVSSREVMSRLKELVEEEDKRHPLSDTALCDRLNKMGYAIARRTVAKYREQCGILPSRNRKQLPDK